MTENLFQLRPAVAGELGPRTVWAKPDPDHPHGPCDVIRADYQFSEWDGDALVKANPVYAATQALADALQHGGMTGFVVDELITSFSEMFTTFSICPPSELPCFIQLNPTGIVVADERRPQVFDWSGDDICLGNTGLVVSERALKIVRTHGIPNCTIRTLTYEQ